ncbi:hypothetical protein DFQ04_3267 [Algoriphagus boseongensis]|uniref:Lipoprotein n=1 Tax=Algoriphagus boseongensis TaxID=1442587 RepID=A0A4R6T472_9BACT|nr:hypothetical protein [Algoriphagus boseongensis]TDQ14677.1 hypothetical protein DFQ04_3267 [Algoriphagus boseongensis]
MNKNILFLFVFLAIFSCKDEEDTSPDSTACAGTVCSATLGSGETAATIPSSAVGVFKTVVTFAEPTSPFKLGTKATFEVTKDQKLIVSIEGKDCITLTNPIWRFGATSGSGNYTFKDNCRDNVAYNLSFNTNGTFNEVNIENVSGPGFFGQFTVE